MTGWLTTDRPSAGERIRAGPGGPDSDQSEEGEEEGQGLREILDLVEVGHLRRGAGALEVEAELLQLLALGAVGARGQPDQAARSPSVTNVNRRPSRTRPGAEWVTTKNGGAPAS